MPQVSGLDQFQVKPLCQLAIDRFNQASQALTQPDPRDQLYGVLLTDSTASKVLREDLRCDLKCIGQGRTDGLKPITKELQHKFAAADLPAESPD